MWAELRDWYARTPLWLAAMTVVGFAVVSCFSFVGAVTAGKAVAKQAPLWPECQVNQRGRR